MPFFCFFLRSVKAKSSLTNSLSLSLTSFSLSHPKQAEPWSQSGESRASKVRKRENKRGGERATKWTKRYRWKAKNRRSEFDIVFFSFFVSTYLSLLSSPNSLRPTMDLLRREPSLAEPTAPRSPFRPLPRAASGLLAPFLLTTTTTVRSSSLLPPSLPLSSTFTASTCSAPRTRSPRPPRPPGPRPLPPRR